MYLPVLLTFVTKVYVVLGIFQHGRTIVSYSLDLFRESFSTKVLSADNVVDVSEDFLGLVRSQTLDKRCDETPFV